MLKLALAKSIRLVPRRYHLRSDNVKTDSLREADHPDHGRVDANC